MNMMYYVWCEVGNDEWFDVEEFESLELAIEYVRQLLRQYDESYLTISIDDDDDNDYDYMDYI